jgi:hypothetical protein
MAAVSLEIDLSGFALADLRVLRLSAQIMGHRASLAARPEVGAFFAQLEGQLALELCRGDADAARQVRPITLTFGEGTARPGAAIGDRRLLAECLDLLADNIGLSTPVRRACASMGEQLSRAH